ncbi:terpene synthase family protein [Chryseobacterium sp. WG23]|uniref:terpene synthase family protein n=1 Tax=Chryseobacterium sp. WG23 TaxID=2926910 RepID=UPI00211F011E|nr:terpene synthase family protein [Chryseobacterium sp. WG23]MCQ9637613.1 terpene synthase family protein [Chryseobacterium sp. WG23]
MKQKDISVLQYPWPYEIGPFSQSFYEEQNGWIDTDYLFMSEVARTKYKNQGLVETASYMFPAASSKELVRPMARFIVWFTLFDDYHKLCPVHQLVDIRDYIMDVMMGQKPKADDIGLIRQVALSREELLPYVNDDWFHRWTKDFYNFTTYGMMEEIPYRLKKQFPALDTLLLVCEYSISIYPYVNLVEPSINFIIPNFISEHPVIKRLKMLMCRIMAIQNDFASIEKELAVDTEVLNIILVIRNQYKVSLEEACTEAMNIHDNYVKEFVELQNNLPDFGLHQKNMDRFVHNMALMISGLGAWYHKGRSTRYKTPGEFPKPEYGTSSV